VRLQSKKILVVGDMMLDKYIIGEVKRISPEAPVPVVNVREEKYTLGGSNNVAHNLARLGMECYSFGIIGQDSNGQIIKNMLKDKEITPLLIEDKSYTSISKIRVVGAKQQIVRIDYEDIFNQRDLTLEYLKEVLKKYNFDGVVISDYGKGLCFEGLCQEIIQYCNERGVKVVIDPKGKNWRKYKKAYIITPNLKELQDISGEVINNKDEQIEEKGAKILKKYNLSNLLVTRSEKGISLISHKINKHYPAKALEVYDVSGAGDTVVASLVTCLSNDYSLEDSIKLANLAASFVVSKFGTYAISKKELKKLLKN